MSTTTFKLGDRVRVKPLDQIDQSVSMPNWVSRMNNYCEQEFTIKGINRYGNYIFANCTWNPSWLEPVQPINLYF